MIYADTSCLLKVLRPEPLSEAVWGCVQLAGAVTRRRKLESGSKLRALQTLRAVRLRLCITPLLSGCDVGNPQRHEVTHGRSALKNIAFFVGLLMPMNWNEFVNVKLVVGNHAPATDKLFVASRT